MYLSCQRFFGQVVFLCIQMACWYLNKLPQPLIDVQHQCWESFRI